MIHLQNVSRTYSRDGVPITALRDASFEIQRGDFVVIRGVSGSGKSTLLNILGCLDLPSSGTYMLDGADMSHRSDAELSRIRSQKIGFVFQSFNLLPRTTAAENVELPMIYAGQRLSRVRAAAALERVGLAARQGHFATELSGGEQQRVAIARALINDPALILADEPTGNLDQNSGAEVMSILHDLNGEGRTIMLVTHDDAVAAHARRALILRDGVVEEAEVTQ
ncbi:ABC transporter ATP-binding protein [Acidicapsa acidisoli]|uniref:ABC transporter ATP-binding protein n=1 Tax=Acidicapsa acidisoli TaxID=1615681 RepID=UPI0021DFFC16|nr:ABC transporter ATP-binding protein [Acidicapsa acidisoli]